jgi:hypothetical protein
MVVHTILRRLESASSSRRKGHGGQTRPITSAPGRFHHLPPQKTHPTMTLIQTSVGLRIPAVDHAISTTDLPLGLSSMQRLFRENQERLAKDDFERFATDSDQGVLATVMGQQNYMRKVARIKNLSWPDRLLHPFTATRPRTNQLSDLLVDNSLSPPFTQDEFVPDAQRSYKYGTGFRSPDQPLQSGRDTKWIRFKSSIRRSMTFETHANHLTASLMSARTSPRP